MTAIRKLVICIPVAGAFGIPVFGKALSSAYVGQYFKLIRQNPPCRESPELGKAEYVME